MHGYRYAFGLSLTEVKNATPPGTATLFDYIQRTQTQVDQGKLRLVPQPTADPADPLKFPRWRKLGLLFAMSLHPFIVNFTSASISSAFPVYARSPALGTPPRSYPQLTYLIAVNILLLGVANLIWVPLSKTFGRRPVLLVSLLILILSSAWAGLATSFESMLAARALMGVGGAPADAVSPEVVGETFFLHERGRAMAVYTVALTLGSLVGPVAGGYIAANNGLAWIHWTNVILSTITFLICAHFVPETLYSRSSGDSQQSDDALPDNLEKDSITVMQSRVDSTQYPSYTFVRSLKPFTYQPGFLRHLLAPFLAVRLPGVWLVSLWYAGLVGTIITMSVVGPQVVAAPPYLWGPNAGLINIGGIIGACIGLIYTYLVADWTTKRLAKRDSHGYSEPESRIVTALPSLTLAAIGTIMFGFVANNPSTNAWVGLQVAFACVAIGLMQAPSVGFNYLIECYPNVAGDCFVAVTGARAIISFAWTFFVAEWSMKRGFAEPFGVFGMLIGNFALLTVPYLVWGKRLRIATAHLIVDTEASL